MGIALSANAGEGTVPQQLPEIPLKKAGLESEVLADHR